MEKQFPEFSAVLFDMDGVIFDTEKVVEFLTLRIHAESASD